MAPPVVINVTIYIWRDKDTKFWIAQSSDLPNCRASAMEPEEAMKRIQSIAFDQIAEFIRDDTYKLSNNVQANVSVKVESQEEAQRLLGIRRDPDEEIEDP